MLSLPLTVTLTDWLRVRHSEIRKVMGPMVQTKEIKEEKNQTEPNTSNESQCPVQIVGNIFQFLPPSERQEVKGLSELLL